MIQILQGDALTTLRTLPDESVHCVVTSPPYWGLRDYGVEGQFGLEKTPEEYVAKMAAVFREVRRVLRRDGTLWLNIGDSYAASGRGGGGGSFQDGDVGTKIQKSNQRRAPVVGLKEKDLVGIPWSVAFALRADGWYLRQDLIWAKPNPMPESVQDRCTKSHEYIFLLTKSAKYFYDWAAVAEETVYGDTDPRQHNDLIIASRDDRGYPGSASKAGGWLKCREINGVVCRNKRSVWKIATSPFPEAHFATFPPELPEICIKAGSPNGGTVMDPFSGAGTTGLVAARLGRSYIGIELNFEYVEMSRRRIEDDAPMFNQVQITSINLENLPL